jgi:anti-sigma B factor antagonist
MTAASYALRVVTDDAPVVVAVTGELDVTNVSEFAVSMEDVPAARPVVLDLSELGYLDSAGLATLDRLTGTNIAVVVIPRSSPLFRAAELMDLPRHDSLAAAISAAK